MYVHHENYVTVNQCCEWFNRNATNSLPHHCELSSAQKLALRATSVEWWTRVLCHEAEWLHDTFWILHEEKTACKNRTKLTEELQQYKTFNEKHQNKYDTFCPTTQCAAKQSPHYTVSSYSNHTPDNIGNGLQQNSLHRDIPYNVRAISFTSPHCLWRLPSQSGLLRVRDWPQNSNIYIFR